MTPVELISASIPEFSWHNRIQGVKQDSEFLFLLKIHYDKITAIKQRTLGGAGAFVNLLISENNSCHEGASLAFTRTSFQGIHLPVFKKI